MSRKANSLFLFFTLAFFHTIHANAQANPAKLKAGTTGKPIGTQQAENPQPVNPYAAIDQKTMLIPDSLSHSAEGIALYIRSNFKTNSDKVRAAFIWVTMNISYDYTNMYAINFYEKEEDKIAKPLITRKGVCENYAALFTEICRKTGVRSFVIEGFVKQNSQISNLAHAWSTVLIDSNWWLYDPTWGSGYLNDGKFVRTINNDYYQMNPSTVIKTHMPFDYLWQLLYYPVTFQEFNQGLTNQDKLKSFFNYKDSIGVFEKQTRMEYYQASALRIEKNGVKNAQVFDWLVHIRQSIEQENIDSYNGAIGGFNDAVHAFNEFIRYRNKQFQPMRADAQIQEMIDSASVPYHRANLKLDEIKNPDDRVAGMINSLHKQMADFFTQLSEQQDWLNKYFSKGKSGRRSMFTKVT